MNTPYERLPARAVATAMITLAAVIGASALAGAILPLSGRYMVKAGAGFSAIMLIALGRLRDYHPFAQFGSANQLTTARAALVALLAAVIGESRLPSVAAAAAVVGLIVLALDGVDGWLARRADMASAFGARFDVEVDALLIQTLAILAWRFGKAGPWILLSGLLRYGFVAAGWLLPWMRRPLAPTARGRAICVVQTAVLVVVLVPDVRPPLSSSVAALGLTALGYSFLVDTLRLGRQTV